MSYAIGEVIFGVDLTEDNKHGFLEMIEGVKGVFSQYSGNGDTPYYMGIEITCIDECSTIDIELDLIKEFDKLTNLEEKYSEIKERVLEALEDGKTEIEPKEENDYETLIEKIKTTIPRKLIVWGSS